MARQVVVEVLLGLGVAIALISSIGILVMRDAFQKLHYMAPLSIVAPVLLGSAVLVQSRLSSPSAQTWLTVLILVVASPFLSHATIRAARIRTEGDWRQRTDQEPPAAGRDEG